jgi:hypothetical protein
MGTSGFQENQQEFEALIETVYKSILNISG